MARHGIIRRLAMAAAVAALALTGAFGAASPPAGAASSCYRGTVCVFTNGPDGTAPRLAYATEGDITSWVGVSYWGGYVWNNGVAWAGADHIQLTVQTQSGTYWTCLHYGPQTWTGQATAISIPPFTTVTNASWRGECATWEEGWHYVGA